MHSHSTVPSQYLHQTSIIRSSPTKDPYNYTLNDELSRTYPIPQPRSMIKKIPNGKDVNLGQFPQVVVLFQAAQIERLSSIITSQRLMTKGKLKQNLDRHSYQIQIKQLTGILEQLRETKTKQGNKIQQLNKVIKQLESRPSNTDINTLSNKYERALLQIGKMYDDNTKLQEEINTLTAQLAQANKHQTIQTGNTEDKIVIKKLRQQISALQYANSQAAAQLRQSFGRQMQEYKIRMDEKTILKKEQLEEQLAKSLSKLTKLTAELDKQRSEKWELQNKQRQSDIKIKQYEAKIRNNDNDIARLVDQINNLNSKLLAASQRPAFSSLSFSYSANKNSVVGQPSVTSSFNNNSNANPNTVRSVELQNNVAMLSQQLQRLTELVKNKNIQVNSLEQQISQLKQSTQKQLLKVRIKYEGDIRKQVQTSAQEKEKFVSEIEKYKTKLKQTQQTLQQNCNGLDMQIIKIKQQQRKICEAVFNRKVEALELEYGRDRDEIIRLRKQVNQLNLQVDSLNSKQAQIKSQRNSENLKFLSQIDEQEKRYEFRLKSLEQQLRKQSERRVNQIKQKDRQQFNRLEKQIKQQAEYVRERQADSVQRVRSINQQYDSNIAIIERQKNMKIQTYKQQLSQQRRSVEQLNGLIKQKNKQIGRMNGLVQQKDNQIFELGNQMRQKQRQITRLISMTKDQQQELQNCSRSIKELERQKQVANKTIREREIEIEHSSQILRQKQRQLRHLKEMVQNSNNQNLQQAHKQYELLHRKLDYLSQQTTSAKTTIVESLASSPTSKHTQLLHINSTLQFLCNQITTISRQIYESSIKSPQKQATTPRNFYSAQYVKQLQSECDHYLSIINGNLSSNDSVLKRIWEQIQSNNRYNRQQQEKWRQAFARQEDAMQKLYEQKYKWQLIKYEHQKAKHLSQNLQRSLEQSQNRYRQAQSQKQQLISTHKNMISKYNEAIQEMQKQIKNKQQMIRSYSNKLSQQSSDQNGQIRKMSQIIEAKSKQIGQLTRVVAEYQKRYDGLREQFKGMEEVVGKVLQDRQADFSSMDRLEIQNIQLKRQLKKLNQQLLIQKNQKSSIIERSRQHLARLTQQLLAETPPIISPLPAYQDFSKTTKLLSLQADFTRLQQTIHRLRKQNYQLAKQNYNESTQDYVNKQFAYTKIVELNKQTERLMQQNMELKDEIQRCRLQFTGQVNQEVRYQENLGVMVLLFVEIQALRNRLNSNGRYF